MAVSNADARILAEVDPLVLSCPFVVRANVEAAQTQCDTLLWLEATGVDVSEQMFADISEVGFLTAHTYPGASRETLRLTADWTTLFFLLDDLVEEAASAAAIRARNQIVVETLRGTNTGSDIVSEASRGVMAALRDVGRRAEALGGQEWMDAFCAEVSLWLDSHLWEHANREAKRIPLLDDYTAMRQYTIGMYFEFLLSEVTDGYRLTPAERTSEDAMKLRRLASSEIAWTNDILTLEKELAQGDVHNGVLSLMQTEGLKLDAAIARAIAKHNETVRSFVELARRVRSNEQVSRGMLGLVQALENWMGGHTRWARHSKRYGGSRVSPQPLVNSAQPFEQSL